jgi:hypothetical protein
MDELNSIEKGFRAKVYKHPAAVHIIGGKAVDLLDE